VLAAFRPKDVEPLCEWAQSDEVYRLALAHVIRRAMGLSIGDYQMLPDVTADEVSPVQELALTALLEGKSNCEAAERAGVCRVTVARRVNGDPAFIAAFRNRSGELTRADAHALASLRTDAIAAMKELVTQKDDRSSWLKAADRISQWNGIEPAQRTNVTAREVEIEFMEAAESNRLRERWPRGALRGGPSGTVIDLQPGRPPAPPRTSGGRIFCLSRVRGLHVMSQVDDRCRPRGQDRSHGVAFLFR
jgi:hypothetical protein